MKNGVMRRGPRSCERDRALGDAGQAADARADHDAGALALLLAVGLPAGILDRLHGRRPSHRR